MKKVVLAGNAITADILYSYLKYDNRYEVVGIVVDDEYVDSGNIENVASIGLSQLTKEFSHDDVTIIMAMGYNNLNRDRESMFYRLKEMKYGIETYIHPDASIHSKELIGEGCVVLPNAVVEPHVRLGENTMVWCNVTLAHHCHVEPHCWIASGAVVSGQAYISRNSFLGVNSTIVNEVSIADFNIIGAAAMVSKNTKPNSVHLARSAEEFRYSSGDYVKFFGV
jgi:sugar O-acyltransferase (sialic acid O-acetyltransferase NeuD family)